MESIHRQVLQGPFEKGDRRNAGEAPMTRLSLLDQFFLSGEMAGLPPMYMGGASIIDAAGSSPGRALLRRDR